MDNSYGHPHKETLQRLKEAGTKVYRTDDGGEIMVRVWEDSYAIEVFGEQKNRICIACYDKIFST